MFTHLTLNKWLLSTPFSLSATELLSRLPEYMEVCPGLPRSTLLYSLQESALGPPRTVSPSVQAPSYNTYENKNHTVGIFKKLNLMNIWLCLGPCSQWKDLSVIFPDFPGGWSQEGDVSICRVIFKVLDNRYVGAPTNQKDNGFSTGADPWKPRVSWATALY